MVVLTYGIPLSEKDFLNFGATLDFTELELTDRSPSLYIKIIAIRPQQQGMLIVLLILLHLMLVCTTDTRDNVLVPTEGIMTKYTATVTAPVHGFTIL